MGCWGLGILQQVPDRRGQGTSVSQGPRTRPLGLLPRKESLGGTAPGIFPPSLIHSLIHWFLEAVPRDTRRTGGAPAARAGCSRAPGAVRREAGQGARAGGASTGRPGAGSAAFAGSERLATGGVAGSERPGRGALLRPVGRPALQPRLLRLCRTRPHSLRRRCPLRPPRPPRAASPPPPPPARSVGQSVTERAARGCGRSRRLQEGAPPEKEEAAAAAAGPIRSRARRRTEPLPR